MTFRLCRNDILWKRQVSDATACIGSRNGLMNDARRLRRGGDCFGVERDVAKQQIGLGRLDVVSAMELAWHVPGPCQHGGMVAAGFIEAGDEMVAAGSSRTGAHRQPASELGLTSSRQGGSFLMTHTDPLDATSTHRVGER